MKDSVHPSEAGLSFLGLCGNTVVSDIVFLRMNSRKCKFLQRKKDLLLLLFLSVLKFLVALILTPFSLIRNMLIY